MPGKIITLILTSLTLLLILTSPPVLGPLVRREPTPTLSPTPVTPTPTPTATPDPFAHVPTATPRGGAIWPLRGLPTPSLGLLPPTYTPAATNPTPKMEEP